MQGRYLAYTMVFCCNQPIVFLYVIRTGARTGLGGYSWATGFVEKRKVVAVTA